MTDFDKTLIAKAERISRWHYRDIDVLISLADSKEARERLTDIRWELYDSMHESL